MAKRTASCGILLPFVFSGVCSLFSMFHQFNFVTYVQSIEFCVLCNHHVGEEKIDLEHLFSAIMFINLVTDDETANEIYNILLEKLFSLRSKVFILSKLCMDIEYGVDIVFPDGEVMFFFLNFSGLSK